MMETLHTTLAFVIAIVLLIAVHEFGHFIVARKLGIKVEKFSIGFGPALFSWRSRDQEVEYCLAAIPLGGYVKMLGEGLSEEDDEQVLSEEDLHRAFNRQPVWKRAAVAAAGPMFNFFFAILAYMVVGWAGQLVTPPIIGSLSPQSEAVRAGLMEGDIVHAVNGVQVHSWQQMEEALKQAAPGKVTFTVDRGAGMQTIPVQLGKSEQDTLLIGVADELIGIHTGSEVYIESVNQDSPAEKAGLMAGDRILRVEGKQVSDARLLIHAIQAHVKQPLVVQVMRKRTTLELVLVPEANDAGEGKIGVRLMVKALYDPVEYRMGVVEGVAYGFSRTWEMTALTVQVVGKMVTQAISPDNLGGPIAIAQLAGKTADSGWVPFLIFLALISVNLGVLNLMPVPILDGGHLAYLLLEKLRGRPLSNAMMEKTQVVGMVLIAALMIFAFYNDLMRLIRG